MSAVVTEMNDGSFDEPFASFFTAEQIRIWTGIFGDDAELALLGLREVREGKGRELLVCARWNRLVVSDFLFLAHLGARILEGIYDPDWTHNHAAITSWPGAAGPTSWPCFKQDLDDLPECSNCFDDYLCDRHYEMEID